MYNSVYYVNVDYDDIDIFYIKKLYFRRKIIIQLCFH